MNCFQLFVCANNNGNLVNNLFGVKIFNPVPCFTSSPSSGGKSDQYTNFFITFSFSQPILHFQTRHHNIVYYPTLFQPLKESCIHQNRFLDSHCIVLKHYQTKSLFYLVCFLFVDLNHEIDLSLYPTRVKPDILTLEKDY